MVRRPWRHRGQDHGNHVHAKELSKLVFFSRLSGDSGLWIRLFRFAHQRMCCRASDLLSFPHRLKISSRQTKHNTVMRFSICNEIFKGWKIEDIFSYAARIGYDGVEIAPFTLADSVTQLSAARRTEIREAAAHSKVSITGIHWVL